MTGVIAVVHNAVNDSSQPDEQDVLIQVEAVSQALGNLGYDPRHLPCTLDLQSLKQTLDDLAPLAVFNLVESLDGHGRLIHLVPALVEAMAIPCTGCSSQALYATSHKVMSKERMRAAGLPTADWINPVPLDFPWTGACKVREFNGDKNPDSREQWIIKSLWEHASLGLERDSLVTGSSFDVAQCLSSRVRDIGALGGACFAERYIAGREFNLSLIGGVDEVTVLPPAEILFHGFDLNAPRIVGYAAKWNPDAEEYHNTPRCFDFPAKDTDLLETLVDLARRCWHCFGLRGYARVDFRVDGGNNPFILEVNANPCISPDAGFAAALDRAGIAYDRGIEQILNQRC